MIVKIQNARLAFPVLFEPRTVNGEGKPAFSGSFIFAKNSPNVKLFEEAFAEVASEKWGTKGAAQLNALRAADKLCMHDGDLKDYDGFAGNFYVSARNLSKPMVVDRDKTELMQADGRPYGGCYVDASFDIWAQDNNYGKRINATLRGVRFRADGDAFAGGAPASADEFDELPDEDGLV